MLIAIISNQNGKIKVYLKILLKQTTFYLIFLDNSVIFILIYIYEEWF